MVKINKLGYDQYRDPYGEFGYVQLDQDNRYFLGNELGYVNLDQDGRYFLGETEIPSNDAPMFAPGEMQKLFFAAVLTGIAGVVAKKMLETFWR